MNEAAPWRLQNIFPRQLGPGPPKPPRCRPSVNPGPHLRGPAGAPCSSCPNKTFCYVILKQQQAGHPSLSRGEAGGGTGGGGGSNMCVFLKQIPPAGSGVRRFHRAKTQRGGHENELRSRRDLPFPPPSSPLHNGCF